MKNNTWWQCVSCCYTENWSYCCLSRILKKEQSHVMPLLWYYTESPRRCQSSQALIARYYEYRHFERAVLLLVDYAQSPQPHQTRTGKTSRYEYQKIRRSIHLLIPISLFLPNFAQILWQWTNWSHSYFCVFHSLWNMNQVLVKSVKCRDFL